MLKAVIPLKLSNEQLATIFHSLDNGVMDNVGIVGYAAARNWRMLNELVEPFFAKRNQLIVEYGEKVVDDDGNISDYVISRDSERYDDFVNRYAEIASVETDFEPFTIPEDKAIGEISGKQIIELAWMFETGDA